MREIRVALAFKTAEAYPEPACQAVVFKLQARAVQAPLSGRRFERCRGAEMRLCGLAQNELAVQHVEAVTRCEAGLRQKATPSREPTQIRETVGIAEHVRLATRP